ncbi:MAG: UDP-4-amino-4,6-dideoxy-N-acetyl-beta-L-altrosamine N-acetyltransferase [Rhizobiaceae bacterium]
MRKYLLKNICYCTTEQKMDVLAIRNSDAVRKAMYNEHQIGLNEHLGWIEKLLTDRRQIVMAVLRDSETAVGVVSVNQIDMVHRKADWAFYLDAAERGGVGSALEIFMIEHVFNVLGLEKLNCEVLETNPGVVAMHLRFGFADEGFRKGNVEKDGKRIGVHFLGLEKSNWQQIGDGIRVAVSERIADIEISLDTAASSPSQSVIDEIQAARSKNNVNWMNLLRLSVERSPDQSLPIIREIMSMDAEINALTKRLVEK